MLTRHFKDLSLAFLPLGEVMWFSFSRLTCAWVYLSHLHSSYMPAVYGTHTLGTEKTSNGKLNWMNEVRSHKKRKARLEWDTCFNVANSVLYDIKKVGQKWHYHAFKGCFLKTTLTSVVVFKKHRVSVIKPDLLALSHIQYALDLFWKPHWAQRETWYTSKRNNMINSPHG